MKKSGILQHELCEVIATLGGGDLLVIADAGLPVPPGVRRIDLALTAGIPSFIDTLTAVLAEVHVEQVVLASQMRQRNPGLAARLDDLLHGVPSHPIPFDDFKRMTAQARAVVRTGDLSPYADIILRSGVVYGQS